MVPSNVETRESTRISLKLTRISLIYVSIYPMRIFIWVCLILLCHCQWGLFNLAVLRAITSVGLSLRWELSEAEPYHPLIFIGFTIAVGSYPIIVTE